MNFYNSYQIFGFTQSQYPRLVVDDFSPLPSKGQTGKDGWYNLLNLLFGFHTIISWSNLNNFIVLHSNQADLCLIQFSKHKVCII
jgi:hypothetical protein